MLPILLEPRFLCCVYRRGRGRSYSTLLKSLQALGSCRRTLMLFGVYLRWQGMVSQGCKSLPSAHKEENGGRPRACQIHLPDGYPPSGGGPQSYKWMRYLSQVHAKLMKSCLTTVMERHKKLLDVDKHARPNKDVDKTTSVI